MTNVGGRPPKDPAKRLSEVIQVRVTPEQMARLQRLSKETGEPVAELFRYGALWYLDLMELKKVRRQPLGNEAVVYARTMTNRLESTGLTHDEIEIVLETALENVKEP